MNMKEKESEYIMRTDEGFTEEDEMVGFWLDGWDIEKMKKDMEEKEYSQYLKLKEKFEKKEN